MAAAGVRELSSTSAKTAHEHRVSWTAAGADEAFLWLDRNRNGVVDSGSELFGNATTLMSGKRASNGFEALAELDANHDGVIDQSDPMWSQLLLWWDLNHDGASQANEVLPVSSSRMVAISLTYHWSGRRDSYGNTFRYEARVWLASANTHGAEPQIKPLYDIFFVPVK